MFPSSDLIYCFCFLTIWIIVDVKDGWHDVTWHEFPKSLFYLFNSQTDRSHLLPEWQSTTICPQNKISKNVTDKPFLMFKMWYLKKRFKDRFEIGYQKITCFRIGFTYSWFSSLFLAPVSNLIFQTYLQPSSILNFSNLITQSVLLTVFFNCYFNVNIHLAMFNGASLGARLSWKCLSLSVV